MKMLKQIVPVTFVLLTLLLGSCEKFLDVKPVDSKTREEFWKVKSDVEAGVVGCYNKLQGCVKYFHAWGEVRGDLVYVNSGAESGLSALNQQNIDENNGYTYWGSLYSAINQCNTVLAFLPKTKESDKTFTDSEYNYYKGECITLRALCYFYLARTFNELPYTSQASENDQQSYLLSAIPNNQVIDSVINDLLIAKSLVRTDFSDLTFTDAIIEKAYKKGRVSLPTVLALLSDVYLAKGDYTNTITYSDLILQYPDYQLLDGMEWFKIFYPGNSDEGIFELQFMSDYNNGGDLSLWYSNKNGGKNWFSAKMNQNTFTLKYWQGNEYNNIYEGDLRGPDVTYSKTNNELVWKWAGKNNIVTDANYRSGDSWDANWIFYRVADIILMKAEALNRTGEQDKAAELLLQIRQRAGYTEKTIEYGSVEELEGLILDERARELAFEGKRWFDLVRIAKRQNNYLVIANRIAEAWAFSFNQAQWKARVYQPLSWYLPINKSELDANKNLKQNPYYEQ